MAKLDNLGNFSSDIKTERNKVVKTNSSGPFFTLSMPDVSSWNFFHPSSAEAGDLELPADFWSSPFLAAAATGDSKSKSGLAWYRKI